MCHHSVRSDEVTVDAMEEVEMRRETTEFHDFVPSYFIFIFYTEPEIYIKDMNGV